MSQEGTPNSQSPSDAQRELARLRKTVVDLETDIAQMARDLRDARDEAERNEAKLEAAKRELRETQDKLETIRRSLSFEIGQIVGRGLRRPSKDTVLMLPRLARRLLGKSPRKTQAPAADVENVATRMLAPRPVARHPGRPLVGGVMDTFTLSCLSPDCDLILPRPDNWQAAFEAQKPDVLIIESAWHGNDDAWQYRVASYPNPPDRESLPAMLRWCRKRGVPTVFWNKEDPVHFARFIDMARRFDAVFTTDADCIPRYRRAAGHERAFAMPFAAQPSLHHPLPTEPRAAKACFAGSFYADRHDARRIDMEAILEPALEFPFDIFDRNHGAVGSAAEKVAFPEAYRPAIRGRLEYDDMVRAYKRYRVFLNVNSVKESPTMFSRRVFELLACGTPVISSYSRGIIELLGDDAVMIAQTAAETRAHLQRLLGDEDAWARLSALGLCRVHSTHTYQDRLTDTWNALGLSIPAAWLSAREPAIAAIALAAPSTIETTIAALGGQRRAPAQVVLVGNEPPDRTVLASVRARLPQTFVVAVTPESLEQALVDGKCELRAVFTAQAHYGPQYLDDAVAAMRYASSPVLGRAAHFAVEPDGSHILRRGAEEHRLIDQVPAASVVARAEALNTGEIRRALDGGEFRRDSGKICALHRFNFATTRPRDPAAVDLHWRRH